MVKKISRFFKRSRIKKRKWSGILNGGYVKLKTSTECKIFDFKQQENLWFFLKEILKYRYKVPAKTGKGK